MVRKVSLYKIALKNFTGTNLNVKARKGAKTKAKLRKKEKIDNLISDMNLKAKYIRANTSVKKARASNIEARERLIKANKKK